MLQFFGKYRTKLGQSMVEYALLITLMLAGVLVMGPYVVRSWNANVKGWDDSFKDSYQDPLNSSPPEVLDLGCNCSHVAPCSTPPCCNYGSCGEVQDSRVWTCSPIGCQAGGDTCTNDPGCCSTPVPGIVPDECGTLTDTITGLPCQPDEVPARYYCGSEDPVNPPRVECQHNANCLFQCLNPPNPADTQYAPALCLDDDLNLPFDINISFVEPGKCSAPIGSAPKCQWECDLAFVPGFGATSCECPTGTINIGGTCVIDCGVSAGDCQNRTVPPPPPVPTGCPGLSAAECTNTYGALCIWTAGGCVSIAGRGCDTLVTNVTLTSPTTEGFARCEFFPWCEWVGGGGYCCSALQHNTCIVGETDKTGCAVDRVLGCCQGAAIQIGASGSCTSNGVACLTSTECCSNNCQGSPTRQCCPPGSTGVCQGGPNAGNCCSIGVDCIPGGFPNLCF